MTNWFWYLICILAGFILGIIYFIWLWQNMKIIISRHDSSVWLSHSIARFGLLMISFFLLSGKEWHNWIACLIGWTSLRILILFRMSRQLGLMIKETCD